MCLSAYTYFLHPCWWCLFILCLCVCVCSSLARRWFLSAAQTRELILPKGLTVDLVTVAIFAYSSSSCTSSSSSSLNLPHALSTSNIQVGWSGSGVSLATHTECKSMYFFFFSSASLCLSSQVSTMLRTLSYSNLLYWHNRRETCVVEKKYVSYRLIFFFIYSFYMSASVFHPASPCPYPPLRFKLNQHFTPPSYVCHNCSCHQSILSPTLPCSSLSTSPVHPPSSSPSLSHFPILFYISCI